MHWFFAERKVNAFSSVDHSPNPANRVQFLHGKLEWTEFHPTDKILDKYCVSERTFLCATKGSKSNPINFIHVSYTTFLEEKTKMQVQSKNFSRTPSFFQTLDQRKLHCKRRIGDILNTYFNGLSNTLEREISSVTFLGWLLMNKFFTVFCSRNGCSWVPGRLWANDVYFTKFNSFTKFVSFTKFHIRMKSLKVHYIHVILCFFRVFAWVLSSS